MSTAISIKIIHALIFVLYHVFSDKQSIEVALNPKIPLYVSIVWLFYATILYIEFQIEHYFDSVIAMQQADSKRELWHRIITPSYCNIIQTKKLDLLAIISIAYYVAL
jgi:hypothetical protein